MVRIKHLSVVILLLGAVLPWNATAVNQEGIASRFLAQKYSTNIIESMLAKTLFEIKQGKTGDALNTVNQLIQNTPNFKLAYLIRGDLLASRARMLSAFGDTSVRDPRQIEDLKEEAEKRLESYLEKNKDHLQPNLLIQLDSSQRYAVVVDTSKSRLFLYAKQEDGQLKYIADYYVTIGKNGIDKKLQGDKRTPLGVYFASSKLSGPLPDMYGEGAYPLNYPNEIDVNEKRNGSGIWLHGTPTDTYSRPPRASDGCVVLSNPDIKSLHPILNRGNTPVIIANGVEWLAEASSEVQVAQKQALKTSIEAWRKDWESQDSEAYLAHYSSHFFYSDGDFNQWANYKRLIQAKKPRVSVGIENVSIFSYPNAQQPMVVVNFEQDFKSASLQNRMKKRQYWVHENNQWKIIYEGAV
ncbi:murein L,D-transpeptidase family protein [Methylotenera sp. 1P/1]|jgi:murein L,D-transpeptidase YafK|uniref:L,D-transpeptidase family protein n=1 Tax=Methylotenera sp. 1P/1 TaxID=1131551 RepID=UPI00036ABC99|nr:L,D-transpeptidase family protein [Methylotenera sp. 1P/1]